MGSRPSFLALLLVLLVAACSRTTLTSSVVDRYGGTGETEEMDFWDALSVQRAVSNNDAFHALLLTFGGATDSYASRAKAAQGRDWIKAVPPGNETARVGMIAKAIVIEAKIKGGATLSVFGPSERYATKELNYREWLHDMSPQQAISGAQLIALLSSVEDHMERAGPEPEEDF